jgi:hypothetical protein
MQPRRAAPGQPSAASYAVGKVTPVPIDAVPLSGAAAVGSSKPARAAVNSDGPKRAARRPTHADSHMFLEEALTHMNTALFTVPMPHDAKGCVITTKV